MKKIVLVCIVMLVVLSGCSSNMMNGLYKNDERILSTNNSYNLNGEEQEIDGQTYKGNVEFEGMDTIWVYKAESNCEIEMSYLLSVLEGKAKLVLIASDGTLTTIAENTNKSKDEELTVTSLSLLAGENRIKLIAANKAQIELEIQSEVGEFSKLGM